jgi:hypothetical protein
VLNDHSPPPFPGSDSGVSDDPSRGDDPDESDDWNLLDLLLALFAWIAYIGELAAWLATLPAAIVADLLTFPAREVLYELAVVPMWQLYLAARRPLVMAGFLMPKPDEINRGLVELGISPTGPLVDLAAALASPTGNASISLPFDERSGRASPSAAFGADRAFPRAIVEDLPTAIAQVVGFLKSDLFCGNPLQPSEFLAPWRYPHTNNAGALNGWEAGLSHPGPFRQGEDARVLMNHLPGSNAARADYEKAATPADTESASDANLPAGRHLGDAVDYSVYLVGRLGNGQIVPDFNLDADRGYGYKCWEWDRRPDRSWTPSPDGALSDPKYRFNEPCTIPEGFCQSPPGGPRFNPLLHLAIHYGEADVDACGPRVPVRPSEIEQAGGIPPTGRQG